MDSVATKEEISGCVLVHALLQKVDKATQSKWEEVFESRRRTMENFKLAKQANLWQNNKSGRAVSTNQKNPFATLAESATCVRCSSTEHKLFQCHVL